MESKTTAALFREKVAESSGWLLQSQGGVSPNGGWCLIGVVPQRNLETPLVLLMDDWMPRFDPVAGDYIQPESYGAGTWKVVSRLSTHANKFLILELMKDCGGWLGTPIENVTRMVSDTEWRLAFTHISLGPTAAHVSTAIHILGFDSPGLLHILSDYLKVGDLYEVFGVRDPDAVKSRKALAELSVEEVFSHFDLSSN